MLTSDELIAVVRVHADRVHDAVRRLGCAPDAAVRVVQTSALELVEGLARRTTDVGDPVGWWFARARALGRKAAGGEDALPVGGGVLSGDANQVRLAEALESRPERDRAALLLRDSYDLPASVVATVLTLDAEAAAEVVARARLAFLPALAASRPLPLSDHTPQLAALARIAEGGPAAARETTTRRHAQGCDACAAVLDNQERARRLLQGLTVVALPDQERDGLLAVVEERARLQLPTADLVAEAAEWDDEPHRGYSLSLMALGLVLACGAGIGIGALVSRGSPITPLVQQRALPLVTAAPVITVGPLTTPPPTSPAVSPSPRVFLVTPSPTPTPTTDVSATPTATSSAGTLSVVLDPASGPRDTEITVTGQGWVPGQPVVVQFMNAFGGQAGATSQAIADEQGTFTTTISAHDSNPNPLPGPHQVTADDGVQHAEATFTVTN